jgi:hypothetical protein
VANNDRHVVASPLRKQANSCLIGLFCLCCLTQNAGAEMKLEELIQKLEDANPWALEKVESIFGTKFTKVTYNYAKDYFYSYIAKSLHFEEGLIVEEVELRIGVAKNNLARLIVDFSDDSACFTRDRLKKTWPDLQISPYGPVIVKSYNAETAKVERMWLESVSYWTDRPWGHIAFTFKELRPDCLSGFTFIPTGEE